MITYELAKELKEGGFQFNWIEIYKTKEGEILRVDTNKLTVPSDWNLIGFDSYPTLSELIEVCGDNIRLQNYYSENDLEWQADTLGHFTAGTGADFESAIGSTPEEAVARLWLEINNK